MSQLPQTSLGKTNVSISRIGFGALHLATRETPTPITSVIHGALDAGITMFDTADRYCRDERDKHVNERQLAEALRSYPGDTSSVCLATKGGMLRPDGVWVRFGKPEHIRQTIRESYQAFGGDRPISLWQYHQLDLNYPVEETLAVVKEAVEEGYIGHVGVSNFNVPQLDAARQVVEIVSVQSEYSLWCREVERNGVLDYCQREGLTFLAWRPLGGIQRANRLGEFEAVVELARRKQATPPQLALAWLLARSSRVVPIPGSTRLEHIRECAGAASIQLNAEEIRTLETSVHEEPPSLRLHTPFF